MSNQRTPPSKFQGRLARLTLAFVVALLVLPAAARAQQVFGSIVGNVTDKTGAVIVSAQVTIRETTKGIAFTTKTNARGSTRRANLSPAFTQ